MRLAWATDVHLNFVGPAEIDGLCRSLAAQRPDAVLIGGDVGEAPNVVEHLRGLERRLHLPIYFVLGNHDFYRGSIAGVRAAVSRACAASTRLRWLNEAGVVPLTAETALVGHDGWGDARLGHGTRSGVRLNDFTLIEELACVDRGRVLAALGDEAGAHFRAVLPEAFRHHRHAIALTHVPPFREACWHEGKISDDEWLPYFTCKAAGDALVDVMRAHPDRTLTVLCGHTHGGGTARILPNLDVRTGGATYGKPEAQDVVVTT